MFIEEFGSYLETIILFPESFILTGDYNFHVEVNEDHDARAFLDLLASMGLKQHVNLPAHVSGHTLDLMIRIFEMFRLLLKIYVLLVNTTVELCDLN